MHCSDDAPNDKKVDSYLSMFPMCDSRLSHAGNLNPGNKTFLKCIVQIAMVNNDAPNDKKVDSYYPSMFPMCDSSNNLCLMSV